jgi:cytochrome c5
MYWKFTLLALGAAAFLFAANGTPANAESKQTFDAWFAANTESKQNFDAASLYRSSCAPCHGISGDGRGPLAGSLKNKVPPLNNLADRYSDIYFPERFLIEVIDGRKNMPPHGSRGMPIWGKQFGLLKNPQTGGEDAVEDNVAARQKIEALVNYIRSIQIR